MHQERPWLLICWSAIQEPASGHGTHSSQRRKCGVLCCSCDELSPCISSEDGLPLGRDCSGQRTSCQTDSKSEQKMQLRRTYRHFISQWFWTVHTVAARRPCSHPAGQPEDQDYTYCGGGWEHHTEVLHYQDWAGCSVQTESPSSSSCACGRKGFPRLLRHPSTAQYWNSQDL